MEENKIIINWIVGIGLVVIVIIFASMAITPKYRVYKQDKAGEANLRQQEWEKKILIEQSKAELESAKLKAEAEVARAKGVAEANKIIADGLKGHDEYLRYLWITNLEQGSGRETVYIPTEAGLPILEARRK